jgi:hypothetical protein
MPSSPRNLKAAAWGWRSAVPSWKRMVAVCGPHPTMDEARRSISLCQPQSWKCLRQHDSEFFSNTQLVQQKNKVGKSGKFLKLKLAPSSHHNPPHHHHKSTSKLPSKKHTNFQNPPQKCPQNSQNSQPSRQIFFANSNSKKSSPLQLTKRRIRTFMTMPRARKVKRTEEPP